MSTEMQERARQHANAGIDWLDKNHPDWPLRVPEDVHIRFKECCIVKHMTGSDYDWMSAQAFIGPNLTPAMLGFYVPGLFDDAGVIAEYSLLTTHFRAARAERLRSFAGGMYFLEEIHMGANTELVTA